MATTLTLTDNLKQKSKEVGQGLLEAMLAAVGLTIFYLWRFSRNILKGVFGFIIGAIGLYIYLGIIGLVALYVLDAILHAFLGH